MKPTRRGLSDISRAAIKKAWQKRFYRWRAYAISLTGNETDAEEMVQEAITRTMNAQPLLETEQDAYHYVLAAIRSSAYQMFGRRSRRRILGDQLDPRIVESDPLRRYLDIESDLEKADQLQLVFAALAELSDEHREVVELLVLREPPMKLREVAELQGAPISTVYSRLQAALRNLGRELGQGD